MAAAESNGAPCSGSAKTKETEGGARFLDMDIDLQADGEYDPLGRRPELIEGESDDSMRQASASVAQYGTGAILPSFVSLTCY